MIFPAQETFIIVLSLYYTMVTMTRIHLYHFRLCVLLIYSQNWTSVALGRGWSLFRRAGRHHTAPNPRSALQLGESHYAPPFNYVCEVVGAFGRVGSFWLCHGAEPTNDKNISSSSTSAAPVPRGLSPGCWTRPGSPIYVATPSAAWSDIWDQTLEDRRQDLVFVGNGLPQPYLKSATVVVPHFAVLKKCRINDKNGMGCIQTTPTSPKTYLYGRHARNAAQILNAHGVQTEILETFSEIYEAAARKLFWASCMWLVCREGAAMESPWTVGQVHEQRLGVLNELVDDLFPALVEVLGRPANRTDLDRYLRDYSLSIADAIPSLDLAMAEIEDRNGLWLSRRNDSNPQRYHQELIARIAGPDVLERAVHQVGSLATTKKRSIIADDVGLTFWGEQGSFQPAKQKVVIVGGGIIGSCLALFLSQRRPDLSIIVLDQMPADSAGRTTPASWAWLNANGKSPKSYQIINQLGMQAWKNEPHLASLVSWTGSLVRFENPPEFVQDGGYPTKGPLNPDQIHDLEPLASWNLSGNDEKLQRYTYFFRDEGCVDPTAAVRVLRNAATKSAVRFVPGANVTSVDRDPVTGKISGVCALLGQESVTFMADLVIVAAGAGSAGKGLKCGVELLHRPGAIAYASPNAKESRRLSRILVDPLRSSHVLQRPDGTIVAGGGALEVGGAVGTVPITSSNDDKANDSLLDGARRLSPSILEGSAFVKTCEAVRPMPVDGLPIVGYIEEGLYIVVTHSGMTLGPLLSSMAAAEVSEGVTCDLLGPYRPSRFEGA